MKRRKFLQSLGLGGVAAAAAVPTAVVAAAVGDGDRYSYVIEANMRTNNGSDNWVKVGEVDTEELAEEVVEAMAPPPGFVYLCEHSRRTGRKHLDTIPGVAPHRIVKVVLPG